MRIFFLALGSFATGIVFLATAHGVHAAQLYVSPNTGTLQPNTTKTVQIRVKPENEGINTVVAILTYPQDKIMVTAITANGSAFPIQAEVTNTNGKINITRATRDKVTNDALVATLTVKAKAAANVSDITLAVGESEVYRASDYTNVLVGSQVMQPIATQLATTTLSEKPENFIIRLIKQLLDIFR